MVNLQRYQTLQYYTVPNNREAFEESLMESYKQSVRLANQVETTSSMSHRMMKGMDEWSSNNALATDMFQVAFNQILDDERFISDFHGSEDLIYDCLVQDVQAFLQHYSVYHFDSLERVYRNYPITSAW